MNLVASLIVRVAALASWGATPAPGAPPIAPAVVQTGPPLLVIVERGPGVAVDAESVRAAIAVELGARVVAPTLPEAPASAPRTDMLLVAIRRDRLVLTLRGPGERELTRAVASPADPTAQLRVIAWLAGNLARDQLSTLKLAETAPAEPAPAPAPTSVPAPLETLTAPPTVAAFVAGAPATGSPAPTGPPTPGPSAAATAASGRRPAPEPAMAPPPSSASADAFPSWTVTLSGGIGVSLRTPWEEWNSSGLPGGVSTVANVEVHRHWGAWFLGLVADYGPRPYHQIAGALVFGRQARVGVGRLEGSGGLGAEQFGTLVYPPSPFAQAQVDAKARAYARAAFAGTIGLARQVEAVAQLLGQATITDRPNAGAIAATLGLRLTVP